MKLFSFFQRTKKKNNNSTFTWNGEEDVRAAAEAIYPRLNTYIDWYCEQGMYLPPEFYNDPATWTDILREIQEAFRLLHTREYLTNADLGKRVDRGLEFFGKYFRHLWR